MQGRQPTICLEAAANQDGVFVKSVLRCVKNQNSAHCKAFQTHVTTKATNIIWSSAILAQTVNLHSARLYTPTLETVISQEQKPCQQPQSQMSELHGWLK